MLSSCVWRGKHNTMSTVRVCYFPQEREDFHFFWIKGFPNHWLCISPDHMDHLSVHQQRLQPGAFSWLQAVEQLLLPGPPRACKQCLSSCWIRRRKRGRGDWVLWISVVPITKVSRVAASRSVWGKDGIVLISRNTSLWGCCYISLGKFISSCLFSHPFLLTEQRILLNTKTDMIPNGTISLSS